jgi:endonuclease/exonuclease/phosphatase (EEP) superfamily protein YafD
VHPSAPISAENAAERNLQFSDITAYAQQSSVPVVVLGDFNSTPFTPYFQDLLNYGELHDARLGFGFINTWHAHNFLFQIPIDHALLRGPWEVLDFYTATGLDADHLPIIVKLAL